MILACSQSSLHPLIGQKANDRILGYDRKCDRKKDLRLRQVKLREREVISARKDDRLT